MTQQTNNTASASYLMLWGIVRCSAAFPFEHPLELVKVTAQAKPELSSWFITREIFREKGFQGFTNTILTNFPRRVIKETLRWPVIGFTHEYLIQNFPHLFTREGTNSKIVTGLSVAAFDSLFILPIDQLIAYRVKEKESYSVFFRKRFTKEGISSLYKGFSANFIRQSIMWGTVLPLNNLVKRKFEEWDTEDAHPYAKQAVTSVAIASAIIGWILPLDFVKTRIQMDTSLQNKNLVSVVCSLSRQYRFTQFYAGALPVFIHTIFHATLSGYVLDKLFSSKNG